MDKNSPPTANILIDMTEGNMLEGAIVGCTIQHDYRVPGSANMGEKISWSQPILPTKKFPLPENQAMPGL